MNSSITKVCTRCAKELPLDAYRKSKLGKFGRSAECKSCLGLRAKEYADSRRRLGPSIIRSEKTCSTCDLVKPISEFYRNRTTADGYTCECKECMRERSQRLRHRYRTEGQTIIRVEKRCSRCGLIKSVSAFYRNGSAADGFSVSCKDCENGRRNDLRERRKIEGPSIERTEKLCPSCEEIKPSSDFYRNRAAADGLQSHCKSCMSFSHTQYLKRNPELSKIYSQARRQREQNASGSFTSIQWRKLRTYYAPGGICPSCKRKMKKLTIDHVIPLAKGGNNSPGNIQPLCKRCNSRKGAREIIDYRFDKGEFARLLEN